MEALANVIENKIMKKKVLLFRSRDDGAPCAIARLVQLSKTPKDGVSFPF